MMTPDRLSCEETFRRLDDYIDREWSEEALQWVRDHLTTCEICTSEFTFEAAIIDNVREQLRRIRAPLGLLGRVLDRLGKRGG